MIYQRRDEGLGAPPPAAIARGYYQTSPVQQQPHHARPWKPALRKPPLAPVLIRARFVRSLGDTTPDITGPDWVRGQYVAQNLKTGQVVRLDPSNPNKAAPAGSDPWGQTPAQQAAASGHTAAQAAALAKQDADQRAADAAYQKRLQDSQASYAQSLKNGALARSYEANRGNPITTNVPGVRPVAPRLAASAPRAPAPPPPRVVVPAPRPAAAPVSRAPSRPTPVAAAPSFILPPPTPAPPIVAPAPVVAAPSPAAPPFGASSFDASGSGTVDTAMFGSGPSPSAGPAIATPASSSSGSTVLVAVGVLLGGFLLFGGKRKK